eukprot:gene3567-9567_t
MAKEIDERVTSAWKRFGQYSTFLRDQRMPMCLKRKIMNTVILPSMTYGAETWSLTNRQREKLAVTQRSMERSMLGVTRRDKIRNEDLRSRTGDPNFSLGNPRMLLRCQHHLFLRRTSVKNLAEFQVNEFVFSSINFHVLIANEQTIDARKGYCTNVVVISPGFDVAAFFSPTCPPKPHLGPPVLTVCSDVHHDQHSVDSFPPDEVYFTQLVVRSTQVKFTLPFNTLLGSVHAQSAETDIIHKDAADFTAANLADIWHSFAVHCDLPNVYPVVSTTHTPNNVDKTEFSTNVRPTQNISNNNQTGNDSSILSQFLENSPREPDHALPPESMSNID